MIGNGSSPAQGSRYIDVDSSAAYTVDTGTAEDPDYKIGADGSTIWISFLGKAESDYHTGSDGCAQISLYNGAYANLNIG